jgi:hypothetical protein
MAILFAKKRMELFHRIEKQFLLVKKNQPVVCLAGKNINFNKKSDPLSGPL